MENIEVEIRSFLSDEQYTDLLAFFKKEARLIKEDYQETYYFNSPEDLRIQKGSSESKIWLKKGKIHDEAREEIEVEIKNADFQKTENLFLALGYNIEIKWFRKRYQFVWDNVKVCVDDTRGYGKILELEILATERNKKKVLDELKGKLADLKIELTSREDFEKRFKDYKENWKELTGEK